MTDILIILLGTTMLYVFAVSRIEAYVKTLALQGFLLFLLVIIDIQEINWFNIAFLSIETLVIKAVVIPYFLLSVIRKNEIAREVEPYITQFYSLMFASAIFIFGFVAAFWAAKTNAGIKPLYFGVSIMLIVSSLFLIINRKTIITHILCYMMLENGIFLLSLSVASSTASSRAGRTASSSKAAMDAAALSRTSPAKTSPSSTPGRCSESIY